MNEQIWSQRFKQKNMPLLQTVCETSFVTNSFAQLITSFVPDPKFRPDFMLREWLSHCVLTSEWLSHCVLTNLCCVQFAKIETKKREVWLRHFWYFVATPEDVCVFGKRGAAELMFFTISHSRRYFVILSCAYGPRMVNWGSICVLKYAVCIWNVLVFLKMYVSLEGEVAWGKASRERVNHWMFQ